MKTLTLALSLVIFLNHASIIHGLEISSPEGTKVTSHIVDQSYSPPQLVAPLNNSTTIYSQSSFTWKRPYPLPRYYPLSHYDLYLDGRILAQNIQDNISSLQDYYYYSIIRSGNYFSLYPKFSMAEGYHTWSVVAFNLGGVTSTSNIWTFYIDSIPPFIKLSSINKQFLGWDTRYPDTIPHKEQRHIYVYNSNPLLSGEVEANANLQFTLLCPFGIPSCNSLTQTYNYPSGKYALRFYNLLPHKTYAVYLAATDAAVNSTYLPVFYLTNIAGLSIPPALPNENYFSSDFIPVAPVAPPPPIITPPVTQPQPNYTAIILLLLIIGLPLHLALTQFGTATNISLTHKFLYFLLFPFIGNKKYQTHPFTTIIIYDSQNTGHSLIHAVTDITGKYTMPRSLPHSLYTKAFHSQRSFQPTIITADKYPNLCLFLLPTTTPSALQRLQAISMSIRSLPLALGIVTSGIYLVFIPSFGILIYLFLCLQATFSEYIYPKINS